MRIVLVTYPEQVVLVAVGTLGAGLPVEPSATWAVVAGRTVMVARLWVTRSNILGQTVEAETVLIILIRSCVHFW